MSSWTKSAATAGAVLLFSTVAAVAGELRSLDEALGSAQAVAHVRLERIAAAPPESRIASVVSCTVSGRCAGLGGQSQFEMRVAPATTRPNSEEAATQPPPFTENGHYIVVLARRAGAWDLLHRLAVTNDGLIDCAPVTTLAIERGMRADEAVHIIEHELERNDEDSGRRVRPSGRNQPWNLMRVSPLRRVWPFFPH